VLPGLTGDEDWSPQEMIWFNTTPLRRQFNNGNTAA
jgi:hypothetical protein